MIRVVFVEIDYVYQIRANRRFGISSGIVIQRMWLTELLRNFHKQLQIRKYNFSILVYKMVLTASLEHYYCSDRTANSHVPTGN
jgi:hypothetical protein